MSDTPKTDAAEFDRFSDKKVAYCVVRSEFARNLERENAQLRKALERRNRDASVLQKLHEEYLAPAINTELIQAEDAADALLDQ